MWRGEIAARQLTARSARRCTAAHGETAARRLMGRQPRCGSSKQERGSTGRWPRGRCRRGGARRLTATAHGDSSRRDSRAAQAGGGARWLRVETAARGVGRAAAARRDGRMLRRPLARGMRGEAAARRDGRASMKEAAAEAFGVSRQVHTATLPRGGCAAARRDASARHPRGETAMWRGGETAAGRNLRAARRPRGDCTARVNAYFRARWLRGETAAWRDGRVARRQHGETAGGGAWCLRGRPHGEMAADSTAAVALRTAVSVPLKSGPRDRRRGRGESDSRYHFRRKSNTPSSILVFNHPSTATQ
jgi:hypothetical protein